MRIKKDFYKLTADIPRTTREHFFELQKRLISHGFKTRAASPGKIIPAMVGAFLDGDIEQQTQFLLNKLGQ